MPCEFEMLKDAPYPNVDCPVCHLPLVPCMRGLVQRSPTTWSLRWHYFLPVPWMVRRTYCAIICERCHNIIGYEHPSHPWTKDNYGGFDANL